MPRRISLLLAPLASALPGCGAADAANDAPVRASLREASVSEVAHAADAGPRVDGGSLYPQVADILHHSCSYERCHAGTPIGAGLSFAPGTDYRAQLVNVTACEYDRMARVTPGEPEQSWLWIKLTAPFRPLSDPYAHAIYFTPPANWDETRRGCRDQTDEGVPLFGQRMPSTAPNQLPPEELAVIRQWILQGAPP